jgi:hypothetical protein
MKEKVRAFNISKEDVGFLDEIFGGYRETIYEMIRTDAERKSLGSITLDFKEFKILVAKELEIYDFNTKALNNFNITIEYPINDILSKQGYSLTKKLSLNYANLKTDVIYDMLLSREACRCLRHIFNTLNKEFRAIDSSIFDICATNLSVPLSNAIRKNKLRTLF